MDIFYDTLIEMGHLKEVKMATKEDIKMVLEMMNKRFEALDNRFEGINKRFALMFTLHAYRHWHPCFAYRAV